MNDPRLKDAIRNVPNQIAALSKRIESLQEDNKYMKGLLRDIKKSIVRKYGAIKDEETTEEKVDAQS